MTTGASRHGSRRPSAGNGSAAHPVPEDAARSARLAGKVSSVGGVMAVVAGGVAITTTWASRTTAPSGSGVTGSCPTSGPGCSRWRPPSRRGTSSTTGTTASCTPAATCGRSTSCTTRASTTTCPPRCASRSPRPSGPSCPSASLCLFGIRPGLVETARGVNLLYQYWIHTETIGALARPRSVNTPSHHRVHHGSNRQYLDRNHGSILIVWDRLFGTFEPEGDRVVYGLTKNINTFNRVGSPRTSTRRCCATSPPRPVGANACPTSCAGRDGPPHIGPNAPPPTDSADRARPARARGPGRRLSRRAPRGGRNGARITPMNVLLVTLDQFRGDCLSAAGHPVVRTPNLDRLAGEGVRLAAPLQPGRAVRPGSGVSVHGHLPAQQPCGRQRDPPRLPLRQRGPRGAAGRVHPDRVRLRRPGDRSPARPRDPTTVVCRPIRGSHRVSTWGSTCPTSRTPGGRGSSPSATTCPPGGDAALATEPTARPSTACPRS